MFLHLLHWKSTMIILIVFINIKIYYFMAFYIILYLSALYFCRSGFHLRPQRWLNSRTTYVHGMSNSHILNYKPYHNLNDILFFPFTFRFSICFYSEPWHFSRLLLNNFPDFPSSWLLNGMAAAQMTLLFYFLDGGRRCCLERQMTVVWFVMA